MGDHDADVALTALSDLCANQTPSGLAALTRYLSRVDDRELEQLQISAVDLLCDAWSGGASDVIATALRRATSHLQRRPAPGLAGDGAGALGQAGPAGPGRSPCLAALRRRPLEHGPRRTPGGLMSSPQRAEAFLRELQGAVSSRRLYAPDHPRNVDILDRLEGARRGPHRQPAGVLGAVGRGSPDHRRRPGREPRAGRARHLPRPQPARLRSPHCVARRDARRTVRLHRHHCRPRGRQPGDADTDAAPALLAPGAQDRPGRRHRRLGRRLRLRRRRAARARLAVDRERTDRARGPRRPGPRARAPACCTTARR